MVSKLDDLTAKASKPRELDVSCTGSSCITWDCDDFDFEVIVGDDKTCRVHSVLAVFLSQRIARLRRCDISFDV